MPQQPPSIVLVLWTWFALVFIATLAFFVQLALVPLTWWWDRNRRSPAASTASPPSSSPA
jgi:hypothetical protein